jgi:hypothetical protein
VQWARQKGGIGVHKTAQARQAAEKMTCSVILSEAKNLSSIEV